MFPIAFDLTVADVQKQHPKGVSQAYVDIGEVLVRYGFQRVQGSVYTCDSEDLANLFAAMQALHALQWFARCVRDIRAFRIEQWSDFTPFFRAVEVR